MADPYLIEMTSDGEGITEVSLGDTLIKIVTRFNYSIEAWTMDLMDARGDVILAGLMLVPNIDMLSPYTEQRELLGSLVLFEKTPGDYLSDSNLGINTKLVWYPPGTEVVLSI